MNSDYLATITARTQEQHGLVSVRQALADGVPELWLWRAREIALLTSYRRGVLVLAGTPSTPWQPLMAACLAAGDQSAASHLSGAWLHRSQVLVPNGLEITAVGSRTSRLPDVRQHQTMRFDDRDLTRVEGIPTTSPARTALDLAAVLSLGLLARTMNDFLRRRLCGAGDYVEVVQRLGGRGRSGTRIFRLLAEERLCGQLPTDSDWADRLMRQLEDLGVTGSVDQHLVTVGRRDFLIDRAWPQHRTGLEFDGFDFHGSTVRDDFDDDRERDLLLEGAGWRIHRVTSRSKARTVRDALLHSFATAHPPATSSRFPLAGEGKSRSERMGWGG